MAVVEKITMATGWSSAARNSHTLGKAIANLLAGSRLQPGTEVMTMQATILSS